MNLETLAQQLASSPDYRVIRRLQPVDEFLFPGGGTVARGVIVDTETTGLNAASDKIIELGLLLFEYCPETGDVYRVVERYSALEDPGIPIVPLITNITGITDDMVHGLAIEDAHVERMLQGCNIVIAHNAGFDRPFLEKRLPVFANYPWACSYKDIDWNAEGLGTGKLDYLAYRYGFFFDGHRAINDCEALLEIVRHPLPESGEIGMAVLQNALSRKNYLISADNSPYSSKDVLKNNGYRWSGTVWSKNVDEDGLEEEKAFLAEHVYHDKPAMVSVTEENAWVRYSTGRGEVVQVVL